MMLLMHLVFNGVQALNNNVKVYYGIFVVKRYLKLKLKANLG